MTRTKVFLTSGTAHPTLGRSPTRSPIGAPCACDHGRGIGSGTPLAIRNCFEGMGKTTK